VPGAGIASARVSPSTKAEPAAAKAGTAAAMNSDWRSRCAPSIMPPMTGPTIEPMRPIPGAQKH
jgi:hypothetical protein